MRVQCLPRLPDTLLTNRHSINPKNSRVRLLLFTTACWHDSTRRCSLERGGPLLRAPDLAGPLGAKVRILEPVKILVVCTGNICRSPIAQRMLEQRSSELGLGWTVSSAGTRAMNGHDMHPESARVLRDRGLEPGTFASRLLTPPLIADSDLVLCLAREHRAVARQLAPIRWRTIITLREAGLDPTHSADPNAASLDIVDPLGRPPAEFDRAAAEIAEAVEAAIAVISRRQ